MADNVTTQQFILSNLRLSFPKLVEAIPPNNDPTGEKRFGADFLIAQNDPQLARFMGEVNRIATEKWKENAGTVLQMIQSDRKMRCYGQGMEKIDPKTFKPYLGYENMMYISSASTADKPPVMIRPDGSICDNSVTLERQLLARKLYGGCFVNACVQLWPQDNGFGRAIRCQLMAVQFNHDGDAFGEAPPNFEGMFGAVQGATPVPMPGAIPFPGAPMPAGLPSFFG